MSLSSGIGRIKRAERDLLARWQSAAVYWQDANSEAFEEYWLRPLLARIRSAEKAMAHMDDVVSKARRECDSELE